MVCVNDVIPLHGILTNWSGAAYAQACFVVDRTLLRHGSRIPHTGAATTKKLVAHRGASAYAPEHTLTSYRLALQQKADYVEQDLAVTKDLVLVCLHDDAGWSGRRMSREVFPDRATVNPATGRKRWLAVDFTLAEIKRLDAGAWFDARNAGERIPTWEEAVDAVGTAAGLYPELKTPALYRERGMNQTAALHSVGEAAGSSQPGTRLADRAIVRRAAAQGPDA